MFVAIGNCRRKLTVYVHGGINDFKSLRLKLLCKSCLTVTDVFAHHPVQVVSN